MKRNHNVDVRRAMEYLLIPVGCGMISMLFHPKAARFSPPEPQEGEVLLQQVAQWEAPVLWVDARETEVFEKAHIPHAISLNAGNFESNLPLLLSQWQPGDQIVVYCDTQLCDASHELAERLRNEVGLLDVRVLFGGWSAWKTSN